MREGTRVHKDLTALGGSVCMCEKDHFPFSTQVSPLMLSPLHVTQLLSKYTCSVNTNIIIFDTGYNVGH